VFDYIERFFLVDYHYISGWRRSDHYRTLGPTQHRLRPGSILRVAKERPRMVEIFSGYTDQTS
jgi:hypothetical protein